MLRISRIYTDKLHADLRDYAGLRRYITTKSTKGRHEGHKENPPYPSREGNDEVLDVGSII